MASKRAEQKPDVTASLMNDFNKRMFALVRMALSRLLLPPLLLAPRDRARHRTWQRTARPTSRRPEALMSDKALPPHDLPMRVLTLGAGRPPEHSPER